MRSESSNRHASRGIAVDRDESMRPAETSLSPDASPRSPSLSSFPTPYRRRSPLAAPALTPLTSYLNPTSRGDAPARFPYRRRHTAPAFAPPPNPSRSPAGPPSRTTQPGLASPPASSSTTSAQRRRPLLWLGGLEVPGHLRTPTPAPNDSRELLHGRPRGTRTRATAHHQTQAPPPPSRPAALGLRPLRHVRR
jgi:hypothetical protein